MAKDSFGYRALRCYPSPGVTTNEVHTMKQFFSLITNSDEDLQRRWTFHLKINDQLRYVLRINEKSTTLCSGNSPSVKYRLQAAKKGDPSHVFVFGQVGKVLLWSKRLLTLTVFGPTSITAKLSVAGFLLETVEAEYELRGKPRCNLLMFDQSSLDVLRQADVINDSISHSGHAEQV
eukprot:m.1901 g.1901  ORF g.1901 m.1901 type:complete len:177 (+) comp453_c0_seq2:48-578(+)